MKVTWPARSEQECQLHEIDLRRDARKVVGLRTIVADKLDLARGEVTNISPGGCGLRLTKRLRCGQYITLLVYPNDRTAAVRIDLARVNWVKGEWAGVESEPRASSTLWRSGRMPLGDVNASRSRCTRVHRGDRCMAAI